MDPSDDPPEKLALIRTIRKLMAFWQIEPGELDTGLPAPPPPPPRPKRVAALPRYRHPISGLHWNGEGMQPEWLRDALLREGYTVDELRRCATEAAEAAESGRTPGVTRLTSEALR